MGWIDNLRMKAALGRKLDERLYFVVAEELDRGSVNQALWLKALEQSDGDERKQTAEYIKLRVQALRDEDHLVEYFNGSVSFSNERTEILQNNPAPSPPAKLSDAERLRIQGIHLLGEDQYQKIVRKFGRESRTANQAREMLSKGDAGNLREAVEALLFRYLSDALQNKKPIYPELKALADWVEAESGSEK